MAAPAARPPERGYHQDYIARIRYENILPPPPGPPKLLNIPTEGLNYFTSAHFSSRLARQQPLNIEADAELGMPIDLVGVPGIFDGDESCKSCDIIRYRQKVPRLTLRSHTSSASHASHQSQGQKPFASCLRAWKASIKCWWLQLFTSD